jgi:hypothetical protein
MQAWWGSVMLTQGSSACAGAGGMQRGASAMAAAAEAPISAFFISSFPDSLMAAVLWPLQIQCRAGMQHACRVAVTSAAPPSANDHPGNPPPLDPPPWRRSPSPQVKGTIRV